MQISQILPIHFFDLAQGKGKIFVKYPVLGNKKRKGLSYNSYWSKKVLNFTERVAIVTGKILPRRQFLRGVFLTSLQSDTVKIQGFQGIRPPWAVNEAEFVAGCSRCGDCIAACETQILVQGDGGFPEVNFSQGECTFCQKCVDICKQPIFRPHLVTELDDEANEAEAPWAHKIEIQASCLAFNGVECRACEDNCESRAIRFKREIGGIAKPQVNLTACNGCGACINVCPVSAVKILRDLTE